MTLKPKSLIARTLALICTLGLTGAAWATDYTYSNVDSDSLAVKGDGKFETNSFSFQLNAPSSNAATADFPASGYVQLTKISIGARSDNGSQTITTATLTNNKTTESYTATVSYSSGNDFTAIKPDSWSRKEVKLVFGTDGVLVDTTATYTLTFKNSEGTTAKLGYSVVTTVESGTQNGDWKPAMRIYGRTPSGSMMLPRTYLSDVSFGGEVPDLVALKDATGFAVSGNTVTVPNTPIQIPMSRSAVTMIATVEGIPSTVSVMAGVTVNSGSTYADACSTRTATGFQNGVANNYTSSGGTLNVNNGNGWGSASTETVAAGEHKFAFVHMANNGAAYYGTHAYLDGVAVANKDTTNGLRWNGYAIKTLTVGGTKANLTTIPDAGATGMTIKDIQIYTNGLSAAQVAKVTAALNKGWTADASGTTLTGSNVELPDSNNRAKGTITVATDGTYSADLIVVDGSETVGPNATAVLNSIGDYNSTTTVSGTGVLKRNFTSNNSLAFNGKFSHSDNVMIGACSGNNTATVTIGKDADVTVSHLRFLNSAYTTASATLDVYGTLTVDSVSTDPNVWNERNDYKGILFGHWKGTGNYNIYTGGSLIGEAAYLQLVFTAGSQTLAVNGGTLKVRGIQANNENGALTLSNGGRLELAEGFINSNIEQTYGYGTISAYSYSGSKGWTSSQPATFNDTENGTTIDPAGLNITFSGAISGAGKIIVNDSVGGGKVSFTGDMSGFTGSFAVASGTLEVPSGVKITSVAADAEVVVKASTSPANLEEAISGGYSLSGSLTIPESVEGTVTFVDSSGNTALNEASTWENGVRSFAGTAPVYGTYSGNQWVWDYEFNGDVTSIGTDTGSMTQEGSGTSFTAVDANGNRELYFQKTPYRGASFSSYTEMTAVMYCAPGNYANTVLVGFGSTTAAGQKAIALVTGANPSAGEMKLVLTEGAKVTSLANLTAVGATTTKHLYAFVMDRITEDETPKTRIRVYLDGKVKAIYKHNGTLALSDGFQIGSLHGGVVGGLTKYNPTGNSGTLDFLRVTNGKLSDGAMAALANAYPYESAHGEATRDPVSSAASWVATDAWTQAVPNQDNAIQDAPNADTNVKISIDGSSAVSVALNLTTDSNYESVTFAKEAGATGSLKITSGHDNNTSGKLVAAESSILVNTTIPAGRVKLGIASVADGVTLTVDPYSATGNYAILSILESLPLGGVYEDEIISMALLGEGASVVFDDSALSDLAAAGFTATFVYNESNQSYTFRVVRGSSADVTVNITALGTTWMAHGVAMPAPETLTLDSANTVTINNISGSAAEISTDFGGCSIAVSSGTVELSGDSSVVNVSGAGTVKVTGSLAVSETFANTLTLAGDGTVTFATLPASALTFGDWTGTVAIPEITADKVNFNNYGISGSTVKLAGGMSGGWLANEAVLPAIEIPGNKDMIIASFSPSFANTFAALKGSGTFKITATANEVNDLANVSTWGEGLDYSAYIRIADVSQFTGWMYNTADVGVAFGESKPAKNTTGGKFYVTGNVSIKQLNIPGKTEFVLFGGGTLTMEKSDFAKDCELYGTLTVADGKLQIGEATEGGAKWLLAHNGSVINLNGGELSVCRVTSQQGSATIHFNGGTLTEYGEGNSNGNIIGGTDADTGTITLNVKAGGAIVKTDTNTTITPALQGDANSVGGGLVKKGTGTLTLAAAPTFTGAISVEAGKIVLPKGTTTYTLAAGTVVESDDGTNMTLAPGVAITVPSVANTTVTVKIGDDKVAAALDGKYYVVPGSTVTVTYAAVGEDFAIADGTVVLDSVTEAQTVSAPTVSVVNETWTGAAHDNNWNNAANWNHNAVPTAETAVTIPETENGTTIYVGNGEGTCGLCKTLTLNGDLTLTSDANNSEWCYVSVHGDVSGTGRLILCHAGIPNDSGSEITVSCPVVIANPNSTYGKWDDSYLQTGPYVVTGDVSVNSRFNVYGAVNFQGKVTIHDCGILQCGNPYYSSDYNPNPYYGNVTFANVEVIATSTSDPAVLIGGRFSGNIILAENAILDLSIGTNDDQNKVTDAANVNFKLSKGSKLYVPAGALVTEANITAVDDECYVAKNGTVYTVDTYKTVTFSGDNMTVTRTDSLGDAIKAGDTVTFTVAPEATYKVESVMVGATELTADNGTYSLVVDDNVEVAVTTALDLVTFTVEVPENTTVTVTGATLVEGVEGNNYQAIIGAKVTITYTPTGAYVGGAVQQVVTVTQNQAAVQAPAEYAPVPAVAQVGNDYYATLQGAVDQGNVTVKILGDVTLADKLVVDDGQTVAFAADSAVTVTGQLRVVDGSNCTIGQNVTFTSAAHPTVFVLGDPAVKTPGTAKSTLVVNGAVANTNPTFDGAFAISGNGLDTQGANITINGTVTNPKGIAIYQPQPGSLTVNGTVSGASAISIKDGTLTVGKNAVVTAVLADGLPYVGSTNGDSPTGDAIIAPFYPASKGYGTPVVNIQGGTITVVDTANCAGIEAYDFDGVAAPEDASCNVNVSGGTFNTPVALDYCAEGKIPADNGSGSYGVEAGYVITWDVDGVQTTTTVKAGVTPSYGENNPTKANYTFNGWDPAVVAAEANATYTATWTANGVTLGTPAVVWGADFTNAVVSATVENGYSGVAYTLTYGQTEVAGTVENGKVTFNVPVDEDDRYEDFSYTIDAKVGNSSVGSAKGSGIIADEKAWFSATASTTTGGAWATTPTVEDERMTFSGDNTFTPTAASSGKIVVIDMGKVVFGDTNDTEINDAQAGIRIGANDTFVVLTTGNVWLDTEVAASGTKEYHVVITFNYTTMTYSVKVDDDIISVKIGDDTISDIPLANSATKVTSIEFKGAGSLESLTGEYFEGAMVKDNNGETYDTVAEAIAAYAKNSAIAPLTMLHDGTAPQGWAIEKGKLVEKPEGIVVEEPETEATQVTSIIAVPQSSTPLTAATLINTESRSEVKETLTLKVYNKKTKDYNSWKYENGNWVDVTVYKATSTETTEVPTTSASEVELEAGDAVWVTYNPQTPLILNGEYATEPVEKTLDAGYNLVAPLPREGKKEINLNSDISLANATSGDRILIPTEGAPINCQLKGNTWQTLEVYEITVVNGISVVGTKWVDAPTIPAGTGFWYVSEGAKTIGL